MNPGASCTEDSAWGPALMSFDKLTVIALLADNKTESTEKYKEQNKSCIILYPKSHHHRFKEHLLCFL